MFCFGRSLLPSLPRLLASGMLLLGTGASAIAAEMPRKVDFQRDVQPILAERCLVCHGADTAEAGLRLDDRDQALAETDSGRHAIVPGRADASELLRRVVASDPEQRMPPDGERLSSAEVSLLRQWIASGANWSEHWAYRPLDVGKLPAVANPAWCRMPLDRFVLARLEADGLAPSPPAPRGKLIRRLSYDLRGIPPTVAEIERFEQDGSPTAYEQLVERMLNSPRFGERWGRHWLDKARYADSDGYEKDRNRPRAWRYRDWVISAINHDLPFDQFTIEQLAGDLLPDSTDAQILATAFHRQTLTNTEGGTDQEQWRVAAVMDRTETLGTVWLGLTVGCARCHNHKYDQISQAEYYQLFAFFNNADEVEHQLPPTPTQIRDFQAQQRQHEQAVAAKQRELAALTRHGPASESSQSAQTPSAERIAELEKELAGLEKQRPQPPHFSVRVISERTDDRRTTHILRRGEFKQPLAAVSPAPLSVLSPATTPNETSSPASVLAANGASAALDRLSLARWIVAETNPLPARVAVNQIWQNLFGQGIVGTPNDFGVRGDPPSHPELLDFLAADFQRFAWSRKALIRQIVLSATYRQASKIRPELNDIDPQNRLLARQNRYRLEAEILRDITLSVSGLLSERIGGPSVFPPMPPDAAAISYANNFQWKTSAGEDRYRRGMYTFFKRTAPHPTMTTFDCPDANVTNVRRNRSNTPIGALVLLNNEVYSEAASAWAARLHELPLGDDLQRIIVAFRQATARTPDAAERFALQALLEEARRHYAANVPDARQLIQGHEPEDASVVEQAAWSALLRVLLNLDEFITRD